MENNTDSVVRTPEHVTNNIQSDMEDDEDQVLKPSLSKLNQASPQDKLIGVVSPQTNGSAANQHCHTNGEVGTPDTPPSSQQKQENSVPAASVDKSPSSQHHTTAAGSGGASGDKIHKHSSSEQHHRKDKDKSLSHRTDKDGSSSSRHKVEEHHQKHKDREKTSGKENKHGEEKKGSESGSSKKSHHNTSSSSTAGADGKTSSSSSSKHKHDKHREDKGKHNHDKSHHSSTDKHSVKVKKEVESDDDDIPLASTKKRSSDVSSENKHKKVKTEEYVNTSSEKKKVKVKEEVADDDDIPLKTKVKKEEKNKKRKAEVKQEASDATPAKKGKKKKQEEEQTVWKWWEEEKMDDGVKWKFLEHNGPLLAEPYTPLPKDVYLKYEGQKLRLQPAAEEVATFYSRMLDHDYTAKEVFNRNFFKDWRKEMTEEEKHIIKELDKCDFRIMAEHFKRLTEERKNMTKEEKQKIKEKNAEIQAKHGFCTVDGYKQKIANFRIEPPGLFRGRGDHPKMGKLKRRVRARDVIINCSQEAQVPPPPEGQRWKEIRHDNTVSWLATWTENVQGQNKYVMLNASSKLKGEKDWQKYEMARKLNEHVDRIRDQYKQDLKSKEMRIRQRAVALYFIDKLALRAGNEKDADEAADTVGCCSLRCEHIKLSEQSDGMEHVVEFDFLGKDSIRYYNKVPVDRRVFKNLSLFKENKKGSDDLFDRLNTSILNKYLTQLMEGLTAKVFRTYNASFTLQQQLDEMTNPDDSLPAKILAYNRANRAVAVLCNHQRAVPKTFEKSMATLKGKIDEKVEVVKAAKKEYKAAKSDYKHSSSDKNRTVAERKKKALQRAEEQLAKLEMQATDKDENKTIALGTSKLNYLDPRISVAWCKKYNVPIEKVYNKTQREKFQWAIDMAGPDFHF